MCVFEDIAFKCIPKPISVNMEKYNSLNIVREFSREANLTSGSNWQSELQNLNTEFIFLRLVQRALSEWKWNGYSVGKNDLLSGLSGSLTSSVQLCPTAHTHVRSTRGFTALW